MPVYAFGELVPVVSPEAYVHPEAVLIGDVLIGPGCYVGPLASLRGDLGRIELQHGSNVQDSCVLHCFPGRSTIIEPDGHIGHGAVLHGCRIGRGALVGINAVVMDGATIGAWSFVAAHSFVASEANMPERWLVQGTPARPKRALTDAEIAWKANGTRVYQDLARRSKGAIRLAEPRTEVEEARPSRDADSLAAVPLRSYRAAAALPED